jgi:uncharacterized protein (TIGR02145 family)
MTKYVSKSTMFLLLLIFIVLIVFSCLNSPQSNSNNTEPIRMDSIESNEIDKIEPIKVVTITEPTTNDESKSLDQAETSLKRIDAIDEDGNIYNTIKIGAQIWMAENLRTTKYNDGSPIQLLETNKEWTYNVSGYCWFFNHKEKLVDKSVVLYNWNAVNTGKLAPNGWHIPSADEWEELINFLGGKSEAGYKMKASGTGLWGNYSVKSDNSSNFSAIPNPSRKTYNYNREHFDAQNSYDTSPFSRWWTSTRYNNEEAWSVIISSRSNSVIFSSKEFETGLSIRCIKDK